VGGAWEPGLRRECPRLRWTRETVGLGLHRQAGNLDVDMLGASHSLTGESGTSCSWSSMLLLLSPSSSSRRLRGSAAGYELLEDGDNRAIILKGEIGYTVSRSHNEVEWKEERGIARNIGVVSEVVASMVDFFFFLCRFLLQGRSRKVCGRGP
jgi:hypothetical protein